MKTTFSFRPVRAMATLVALGAALLLSACGDDLDEDRSLLERVQVQRGGPDPFLVIERAPLEIPAQLGVLPPPRPGAISRVEPQPDLLVAAALGGNTASFAGGPSASEQQLLASIGATNVPADIRVQIEEEHQRTLLGDDPGILTRALPGLFDPYREQQLDPVAELVRLRNVYPNALTPTAPLGEQ